MKKRKDIPNEIRKQVYERSNGVCEWCNSQRATQMHHKKYRSAGGLDTGDNLIHVCVECHIKLHQHVPTMIKMREILGMEGLFD